MDRGTTQEATRHRLRTALWVLLGLGLLGQGNLGRVAGGFAVVTAYGYWRHRPWSRWLGWLLMVCFGGMIMSRLFKTPTDLWSWVVLILVIAEARSQMQASFPVLEAEPESQGWRPSVVLLGQKQIPWKAEALETGLQRVLGEPTVQVRGQLPSFLLQHPAGRFFIHAFPEPHENTAWLKAFSLADAEAARAVLEHECWMAVEWIPSGPGDVAGEEVDSVLRRSAGFLGRDGCLLVAAPHAGFCAAFTGALLDGLRADLNCKQLRWKGKAPLVEVDDEDPRIVEAVARARASWPSALARWSQEGGQACKLAVKVPTSNEPPRTYTWLEVKEIQADELVCEDPDSLAQQTLPSVALSIVDWVWSDGACVEGDFSGEVIREIRRENRTKDQ